MIEEFEHRNAAIDIYNHVVGSYWFRMRCVPAVFKHLMEIGNILIKGLNEHADKSPEGILPGDVSLFHRDIPFGKKAVLDLRALLHFITLP